MNEGIAAFTKWLHSGAPGNVPDDLLGDAAFSNPVRDRIAGERAFSRSIRFRKSAGKAIKFV
jgi:hypothetical protein